MAAAAVHPLPPSTPPPALDRCIVAWPTRTRLAADAVICLFIASLWLLFWGMAAIEIEILAWGPRCPVVAATFKVLAVAGVSFVLILSFGVVPLMALAAAAREREATATDIKAPKEPGLKSLGAAMREVLRDPLTLATLALIPFFLLVAAGPLVKGESPVKGSRREIIGSVFSAVGVLGMSIVNCFIACPLLTVRVWRAWRI